MYYGYYTPYGFVPYHRFGLAYYPYPTYPTYPTLFPVRPLVFVP